MERDILVSIYHFGGKYFNSHAHVERDPMAYLRKSLSINFNSHAHVERDAVCEQEIKGYFNFNSHAHVERDLTNLIKFW